MDINSHNEICINIFNIIGHWNIWIKICTDPIILSKPCIWTDKYRLAYNGKNTT